MPELLSERSYRHIRAMLVGGELAPGHQLVTRTLAEKIGVSLAPIREAINRLSSEGLVHHVPGSGAYVRKLDRQELDELYVLRESLESCAAAEAARYISDLQLADLDHALSEFRSVLGDLKKTGKPHASQSQFNQWLAAEQEFHSIIISASRNSLLQKSIREYRALSAIFEAQRNEPQLLTTLVAQVTLDDSQALVEALRGHDAETCRQLMCLHIGKGRKTVLEFLRAKEKTARSLQQHLEN